MYHLTRYRYIFFLLSGLVIVPGLLALIFWHLNLGIDFTNGTTVDLYDCNGTGAQVFIPQPDGALYNRSRVSASTTPTGRPRQGPSCRSGTAPATPTSSGPCPDRARLRSYRPPGGAMPPGGVPQSSTTGVVN